MDGLLQSNNNSKNSTETETEIIIPVNEVTELFVHSDNEEEEEEEEEEDGAGYVMRPPIKESKHYNKATYIIISCIVAFMIFIIFIFTSTKSGKTIFTPSKRITLKEIYSGTFQPQESTIFWFDYGEDGSLIQMGMEGDIELYNIISQESQVIASLKDLENGKEIKLNLGFSVSNDLHYILIPTSVKTVFRHSKLKDYVIFDTQKKSYLELKDKLNDISNIEFSPSGDKLAFVKNNNLYFMNLDTKQTTQITHDGSENIFNGISDWVYEEEVLMTSQAFYWSPDSKYLGFIKFDDTDVPKFEIPVYLDSNFEGFPYTEKKVIRYPKPGFPNPDANVYIYDTTNKDSKNNLKKVIYEKDYEFKQDNLIILQVLWATETSENLMIRTSNRVQDTARLFSVNIPNELKNEDAENKEAGTFEATFLKEDDFDDDGWLTRTESIYYAPPNSYIEIMEDNNGYQHINFYDDIYDENSHFITSGEWEVNSIAGIDKDRKIIYYIGSEEGSMQRHLYKVNYNGQRNIKMTPIISELEEQKKIIDSFGDNLTEVGVYSATFSSGYNYYLLNYEGPGVPWQKILSTYDNYDNFHIEVSNNEKLDQLLSYYKTPKFHRFEIPINDYYVNALAIYPPDFNKSSKKKYPVLFHPYGGPNSQMADYSYQMDFNAVLASDPNHPLIVVIVDGRGTAWKGRKFRVNVSKQLASSYGGYLTSKVVEADSGIFKVAMAVAPVTDWRLYDTLYTERYMKTLEDNKEGYINSAVRNVTGFNNVDFLLIHGTEDDNVHFQNSAILASKLTLKGVKYTAQYYTDNEHSMGFGNAYSQLMNLLTNFLYEHLFKK
ncbi:hypothetical protein H8356DRAFT_1681984 [Neocallimastix lanati (nom. inval.)]|nr:hypothetical protein H8356DRAFT_1681984 [Neocallimastix sp. JGI-2020a]